MYRDEQHGESPSVSDMMNDGFVTTASLPGHADWCDFAEGNIDEAELDRRWAADMEAAERSIGEQLRGWTDDEVAEIAKGRENDELTRQVAIAELGRRLRDLLASSEGRAA
jgi:hypothetical protein